MTTIAKSKEISNPKVKPNNPFISKLRCQSLRAVHRAVKSVYSPGGLGLLHNQSSKTTASPLLPWTFILMYYSLKVRINVFHAVAAFHRAFHDKAIYQRSFPCVTVPGIRNTTFPKPHLRPQFSPPD